MQQAVASNVKIKTTEKKAGSPENTHRGVGPWEYRATKSDRAETTTLGRDANQKSLTTVQRFRVSSSPPAPFLVQGSSRGTLLVELPAGLARVKMGMGKPIRAAQLKLRPQGGTAWVQSGRGLCVGWQDVVAAGTVDAPASVRHAILACICGERFAIG